MNKYMSRRLEEIADKLPKFPLSISGTRVVVTYLVVYCVLDLVCKVL